MRELENTIHRAVLLATGAEIGVDGILTPDGARLDQARGTGAVAHAAMAAEQVTRALVGRTVADVERDLILETLKHCLGNRTHAANILGISIRTLRNKLNEYAADGVPVPPPGGGEDARRGVTLAFTAVKRKPGASAGLFASSTKKISGAKIGFLCSFSCFCRVVSSSTALAHEVVAHGVQASPPFRRPARARRLQRSAVSIRNS